MKKTAKKKSSETKLNPCQFKYGCFGCCGHHFTGKDDVLEGLKKNTWEYADAKTSKQKLKFLTREYDLRMCGICHNVGFKRGKIGCLVYMIDKKDQRKLNDCEVEHECKTMFEFNSWSEKRQCAFKKFIDKLEIDWYDFGIDMDTGKMLERFYEFENKQNNKKIIKIDFEI